MSGVLLAWLLACGGEREGGGSAIGNPGKVAVRLASDDRTATATAEAIDVVFEPCDGDPVALQWSRSDLIDGSALELPGGEGCGLEVTLSAVDAPAVGADGATLEARIALESLRLDERDWVLEVGEPEAPLDTERRSALYLELVVDGWLDPLERAQGPSRAGPDRLVDPFEPSLLMVAGDPGLLAPLTTADAPAYATSDDGEPFWDVAHDAGTWVAVGGNDAGRAAASADLGLSWTVAQPEAPMVAVAAHAGTFYGASVWGRVLASGDGLAWETRSSEPGLWRGVASGPPGVVVVGDDAVLYSADGASFARVDLGLGVELHGVTWGPSGFVAVGTGGARLHSADGSAWTLSEQGGEKLVTVAWSGTAFVASGLAETWSSPDGLVWDPLPYQGLNRLERHEGGLVGVSGDRVLRSDDDGLTWALWRTVDEAVHLAGLASNAPDP